MNAAPNGVSVSSSRVRLPVVDLDLRRHAGARPDDEVGSAVAVDVAERDRDAAPEGRRRTACTTRAARRDLPFSTFTTGGPPAPSPAAMSATPSWLTSPSASEIGPGVGGAERREHPAERVAWPRRRCGCGRRRRRRSAARSWRAAAPAPPGAPRRREASRDASAPWQAPPVGRDPVVHRGRRRLRRAVDVVEPALPAREARLVDQVVDVDLRGRWGRRRRAGASAGTTTTGRPRSLSRRARRRPRSPAVSVPT